MKGALQIILFIVWPAWLHAQAIADTSARYQEMLQLKKEWKETPLTDSAFVILNSETLTGMSFYHEGTFPVGTSASFVKSKPGEIFGPFADGNAYRIYKNAGRIKTCDSVQVSHILYAYENARAAKPEMKRTKMQAKKSADSLADLIREGKVLLEDVVEQVTDDPGSTMGNKGNYGWFTRESGFIQVYKDAAFNNPVGATVVIESVYGFHIVQVEAKTKEWDGIKTWEVEKAIDTCYTSYGSLKSYVPQFPGGRESYRHTVDSLVRNSMVLDGFTHFGPIWVTFNVLEDGTTADIFVFAGNEVNDAIRSSIIDVYSHLRFTPAHTCEGTFVASLSMPYPF